ncbi:CDP-alcohol phosphatidyltransferase family protein [Saccharothrix hoggarensis]|uniref:CDP-alcohol phosphatidyltransferase family protein n=1 Tax=Saccharothrix hoggarensis TaxID=913853 RepID=A0ABW3QXL9_9PSEU
MTTLQHSTAASVREAWRSNAEPALWAGVQVLLLGVLECAVGLGPLGWVAGLGYALATQVLLSGAVQAHAGVLGPVDRVTLARGLLVGGVTALVADGSAETALVVGMASVALALDFVDGQVARRTGTASPLGARFDMEVDAFLILVLSVHVAAAFGPWVLVMGALRYAFVAASWVWGWLRGALPPSHARKVVAAVQGIVLVVAVSGLVPHAAVLVGLALAALVWSFGRDITWLWRSASVSV